MTLSQAQKSLWERARSVSASGQAVPLSDDACRFLIARIASDLHVLEHFPEYDNSTSVPELYCETPASQLVLKGKYSPLSLFERLVGLISDADTYFACLASLLKARLKYERVLEHQPIPTYDQIGPRSLLQYGRMSPSAVASLLLWRKWFFDIDNRAGQETGYLFEPILAHAIGGTPVPATKSPVRSHRDSAKGRQVDCIVRRRAYEFKLRVTIAASGQGRWAAELDFPVDCKASKFKPVLVCLDGTPNPKLTQLAAAFRKAGGESYEGAAAWQHLKENAGETMAMFIEKYVRAPLDSVMKHGPRTPAKLEANWGPKDIEIKVGDEVLKIDRGRPDEGLADASEMPEDLLDEENL